MGPEETKFVNWFNEEKKKGLVDLKVTKDPFSTTTGNCRRLTPKDYGDEE